MTRLLTIAVIAGTMVATAAVARKTQPDQGMIGRATGDCVVSQDRKGVARLLETLPGSLAERRAAQHIRATFAACSEGAFPLTAGVPNSGIFNGRADLAAAMVGEMPVGHGAAAKAGSAWYAEVVAKADRNSYDPVLLGFEEFGTCVVGAQPDAAERLVRVTPDSVEARHAIAALQPALGACVVQGTNVHFSPMQLRLMIAEPLYHAVRGTRG